MIPDAVNGPQALALSTDGATLLVANGGAADAPDHRVLVIDTATDTARRIITLPAGVPTAVAITPDDEHAYVTTSDTNSLWLIDIT